MNPLVLIILDGWGVREAREGNAIRLAKTPRLDEIFSKYPHTALDASGEAVGLPKGTMGNSEVGHLTIGSGRIVLQDLSRINRAIEDGSFFKNLILTQAFQTARETGKTVHLMGLLSDAGVHSHLSHLLALLKMAKQEKVANIAIHCFMDGRDTSPTSGKTYLKQLQAGIKKIGVGEIATLIGRYYAMDRDKRWERVKVAYDALTLIKGTGPRASDAADPVRAMDEAYQRGETDEFIKPIVLMKDQRPIPRIGDGDVVIFFNFRPDRARQITRALTDPTFKEFTFTEFKRKPVRLAAFVCLTQYDKTLVLPVAFPPDKPDRTLAEILSERKIPQFHTAETEKYAHVTYFLNGGREDPFPGEERLLIQSPKEVATYDLRPEMSASQVTDAALAKIRQGCPVVIMNYANPDMVGHSGNLAATIRAVEVIDDCIGKICTEVLSRKGTVAVTADHGNCEQMVDGAGGPHTAHTLNPVPFLLVGDFWRPVKLRSSGGLKDVAPTILKILAIPQPIEMTGESLIIES